MPSVHSEQLQAESRELAALFAKPARFVRALDFHFEKYGNRAKRQGAKRRNSSLLQFYDVPDPVMRQLRQELFPLVQEKPTEGLELIDALWERRTREHRELAAYLLGQLPEKKFRNVRARIQRWNGENREEAMIRAIARLGSHNMLQRAPLELLPLCKTLLRSGDIRQRASGLLILKSLIEEGEMDNLPAILDMMTPLYRKPVKSLRPFLLETIESLIKRSPGEALYFLQQRLTESKAKGTHWLAKQAMKAFGQHEARLLAESLAEFEAIRKD